MPVRARKTEEALLGKNWNAETLSGRSLPILEREFTPISDVRGSASLSQRLISSLFEKFFHELETDETVSMPDEPISTALKRRR